MLHTYEGVIAPGFTPAAVNLHYTNTATGETYISVGTASSADWLLMNSGGGGGGSGDALVADPLSQFASTTSAQLRGVISDETGSNVLVFNTSPTLVTPVLGVASATSVNKVAITAPATSATITVADGKTFTSSNTLTLSGTDGSTLNVGTGGTLGGLALLSAAPAGTLTGATLNATVVTSSLTAVGTIATGTWTGTTIAVANGGTGVGASTGSVAVVLSTSPTLVTPVLGVAAATSINKVAITAPATSATLTIADGKTLTSSNTLTLAGTDSSTLNISSGGTLGTAAFTAATAYAVASHTHAATDIATGTIAPARLGSGSGGATKFLREDSTFQTVSSGAPADADYGDITVSSGVWTLDSSVVTYAKIQNVSATDKILGRSTAGAGVVEEIACTSTARSILDDTSTGAVRTTIGVAIGTDVQAYDAELAALAGLTSAADSFPYFTGTGTAALAVITSAARTVLDDTTVGAMVDTIGGASASGTGGLARIDSPAFTTTITTPQIAVSTGTITTSQPISIAQTWNAAGVTFTALKVNATNTASAATSIIADFQLGGVSVVALRKDSAVVIGGDVVFTRDGGAIAALRNGGATNIFRVYNTYTSTTSFEEVELGFTSASNLAHLWTVKGSGAGTARPLLLGADATELMRLESSSKISFFGATAVVKQTFGGAITNNVVASGTTRQFDDFTNGTVYATDYAALHATISQLCAGQALVVTALRNYGLAT